MGKIGIFTYYNNYNYGSYLQSYALTNKICSIGYDACIIDFKDTTKPWNKKFQRMTFLSRLFCSVRHPSLFFSVYKAKKVGRVSTVCNAELKRKFDDFSSMYLNFYRGNYLDESFDAYIVGSDQVWKVTLPGLHYVLFLRFAPKHKRISYAASIGSDAIPSYNKAELKRYLLGFSSISVREDETVKLFSNLDKRITPTFVLDPVLLVGSEFWVKQMTKIRNDDYVFFYFLDPIKDKSKILDQIKYKYPDSQYLIVNNGNFFDNVDGCTLINPSPLEFVSLIYSCKAVVTDSFHGTAFSVLFKKDFYTIPRNYQLYSGQKGRLFSLLRLVGCEDRYMDNASCVESVRPINASLIDKKLSSMRVVSEEYLINSIVKSLNNDVQNV